MIVLDSYHHFEGSHNALCTSCDLYARCSHITIYCFEDVLDKIASYNLVGTAATIDTIDNQVSTRFPLTVGSSTSSDNSDPLM